jgi:DNA (cytosine-5)-methyltransferase 1
MSKSQKKIKSKFTAIDLFSGAGGLTVGLKAAGFSVVAAVEIEEDAVNTYSANHPEVHVFHQDISELKGSEILRVTEVDSIDLIAGCPPCQGFSKFTERNTEEDPRNQLILEMARLVEELKPRICMMENVPGLDGRGSPLLKAFEERLKLMGYILNKKVLQLADFGVPQSRRRLVLLAGKGFKVDLPEPTHARHPINGLNQWIPLRKVIKKIDKPISYSKAKLNGGAKKYGWHVIRDLKPISKERLQYLKPGGSRTALPRRLRPDCHKATKGFQNVYGRMSWDEVAPTMTSGCTTLSAGRFGHPDQDRALSVREAALIQTFDRSYCFEAKTIEKVCELVGNALPCKFATVVSSRCFSAMESFNS